MYYTASGIVPLCRWPSGAPVHRTATYTFYKTICGLSWSIAKITLEIS